MKTIKLRWLGVMLSLLFASSVWASEQARDQVIKVVDRFKQEIVADRDMLATNREELIRRTDSILSPVINFDDFSKKVMGKYYRRASDKQKMAFATATKETLLNTYAKSLLEFDDEEIKVLPLGPQGKSKEVRVNAEFVTETGSVVDIAFYMEEEGAGKWFLSNVVISGVNFGLTFRKQFAQMVQQNRNDLDSAIEAWKNALATNGDS